MKPLVPAEPGRPLGRPGHPTQSICNLQFAMANLQFPYFTARSAAAGPAAAARLASRETSASRGASMTNVTRRLTCTVAGPEIEMPSPRLRLIFRRAISITDSCLEIVVLAPDKSAGRF